LRFLDALIAKRKYKPVYDTNTAKTANTTPAIEATITGIVILLSLLRSQVKNNAEKANV